VQKKITAALLGVAMMFSLASCSGGKARTAENNKLKVSVTFNAMKEFVEAVGKDKVEVSTIIPDGSEPHDFEPKPLDLAGISQASVFVYNGMGMESWVNKAVSSVGSKNLITVDASNGIEPIRSGESGGGASQDDPHVWISLKGAQTEALNIKNALEKADPANKNYYEKNYSDFAASLQSLYNEYSAKFAAEKTKNFVTGHAAFAYLCRDFGLCQNSVEDVFAEGEPSAQKLGQLVAYCRKNNVKTIFVEDMVSPAVSDTLANEVGAKVQKIYTIESSEGGASYLDRMKINLQEIYQSLQ
jgi:zinc transport system substrate-binding protein